MLSLCRHPICALAETGCSVTFNSWNPRLLLSTDAAAAQAAVGQWSWWPSWGPDCVDNTHTAVSAYRLHSAQTLHSWLYIAQAAQSAYRLHAAQAANCTDCTERCTLYSLHRLHCMTPGQDWSQAAASQFLGEDILAIHIIAAIWAS